ncbi:hypothetical protein BDN70DRAFT_884572 [Pholiota conissans]|uniref:SET domain-containing protein n=1 Tax=Pholiota conissans TaxID=109636 RepID=A0A9P5YU41_9AGAR|nr:hypothetical protein BDN70DRAFT_884572 [Pholiota conissans]
MNPSTVGSAALYDILPTSYGGRGAYARQTIPEGTLVLSCAAPYVHVIFWKFRREVCAWCFEYAFESGKNKWSVRLAEGAHGEGSGAWFCSQECRDAYLCEHQVFEGQSGNWRAEINASFAKLLSAMAKDEKHPNAGSGTLTYLDDISKDVVSQEFLEKAWTLAKDSVIDGHQKRKAEWMEELNEFEIDTARFVLEGLLRKIIEEINPVAPLLDHVDDAALGYRVSAGRWADFMALQDNELSFIRANPYMLPCQIRIYRFLRNVAANLSKPHRSRERDEKENALFQQIADRLREHLSSPEYVRALLGRDPGNVFGIWDMATDDGSEMLGWGAFVFASYYNHST